MEGLDAKRIFARLQLEGEEFLLTSPFIELTGLPKPQNGDFGPLKPRVPALEWRTAKMFGGRDGKISLKAAKAGDKARSTAARH